MDDIEAGSDLVGAQESWPRRVFAAWSQLGNVVLFNGSPNETISARCWRQGILNGRPSWRRACSIINAIAFFQSNHCRGAYYTDVKFAKEIAAQEDARAATDSKTR